VTRVIGLTGYAGVGKDTMAALLHLHHGFTRYAFADRLKDVLRAVDPIVYVHEKTGESVRLCDLTGKIGWDDAKRIFPEVRRLLQRTGMGVRDHVDKQIWIDPVIKSINQHELAVVSDVRLPNEVSALRSAGWGEVTLVRLTRKGIKAANEHISEHVQLDFDVDFDLSEYELPDMPQAADDLIEVVETHQRKVAEVKRRQQEAEQRRKAAVPSLLNDPVMRATYEHLSGDKVKMP